MAEIDLGVGLAQAFAAGGIYGGGRWIFGNMGLINSEKFEVKKITKTLILALAVYGVAAALGLGLDAAGLAAAGQWIIDSVPVVVILANVAAIGVSRYLKQRGVIKGGISEPPEKSVPPDKPPPPEDSELPVEGGFQTAGRAL